MALTTAIAASCDTYFYELGHQFYRLPPERGHPLQAWASRFGFGAPTGIDVGPEDTGLLPTPEWRQETYDDPIDQAWKPGDSIQLAIGQKDLLVTPMQMARFYALIANGGKLVTPHVVMDAERPGENGAEPVVRRRFTPPAPQPSGVDPAALAVVREGLRQATQFPNGTSAWVFDDFPIEIAGKTGTAEKVVDGRLLDQSWWCGYGPVDDPELVVCALIENGGHGSSAAAPAARRVFEAYFGIQSRDVTVVESE
jgi:penicillin-binding protein 2